MDTDICVHWLRRNPSVRGRLLTLRPDQVAVSVITVGELYYGAAKSARKSMEISKVEAFLAPIAILSLTDPVLRRFGDLKSDLEKAGERLDNFDLLIAASALTEGRVLVTHNTRHFRRIAGLSLENWYSL
ncbi:MAG: PIN domain-containing protein [Armatimonadetes bacterium]|nr:PIN domain-containing protein [Armatimonadota bacterium]